ncbi:MAG TPA: hypothetical protein VLE43_01985 [Candidatus Saccharimonadia bacterium]|nr:hypothetical protein [Candidatus Saccharimonadia bacterium]
MKARVIIFVVLLAGALAGHVVALRLSPEYQARVSEVEQGFLDFLVANSQESFQKSVPEQSSEVVLIDFREADKAEFSAWPPAPLDYIMLMKLLAPSEPEVLVFTEPLRWDTADTQFIQQLRQALLPVPSVILGFDVSSEATEMSPEQKEFAAGEMPSFNAAGLNPSAATVTFKSVTRLPDKALRIGTELGIARVLPVAGKGKDQEGLLPFVAYDGTHLVPSVAAQAVARFRYMPSTALHLRFGIGGRLGLSDAHVVPLDKGGAMKLQDKPVVPRLDVLTLFTPSLEDNAPDAAGAVLGKKKVLVIGSGAVAQDHAQAIAQALAVPHLHRAPPQGDWAFAGMMALLSLWQFRHGRFKVLLSGILLIALGAIICMLTFQSSLWWWSPVPAAVVLATTTLFCFLWPRRSRVEPEHHGESAPAVGEGVGA